jgi:threonyl-tRNA synthetase
LTRVRSFAQDDAHIFCTPEQVQSEVSGTVAMFMECYALFNFEISIFLSTRPEDRAGADELWDHAEADLRAALEVQERPFETNEGDGAFYGPKIDFIAEDALKRKHQLGTIQLDYVMPDRFGLRFIDAADQERTPVMIHRAMLGSLERFIGILIEHCAGAIPFWLAPEQVRILPITERAVDYANRICGRLREAGLRSGADLRNEKIGAKIRESQLEKIPVMLVIGDREVEAGTVAVRLRRTGDQGAVGFDSFLEQALGWNERRCAEPGADEGVQ